MKLSILSTAFGSAWSLISGLLSKVPFLKSFLSFASGPFGAIVAPIVKALTEAVTEFVKLLGAYITLFLDAFAISLKNLKVWVLILTAFVGGIAYGIHLDRSYLPVPVAKVSDCKKVIDQLHRDYTFIPKKKK